MSHLSVGTEVEYRYNKRSKWKRGRVYGIEADRPKWKSVYGIEYWVNGPLWAPPFFVKDDAGEFLKDEKGNLIKHIQPEGSWYFYMWLTPENVRPIAA